MRNFAAHIFLLVIYLVYVVEPKDLYKILQVERSASQNEIKRKYRELTRLYHPDKNQGDKGASAKFAEVAEAYEILNDPKKRRKYDRGGMDAIKNDNEGQNFDPFDIFGMFNGGKRENREADVKIKLRVSLKDLYLGKEHEFVYTRNTMCPHCRGSGADSYDDVKVCDKCKGQGVVIERQMIAPGYYQQFQTHCPKCSGKGKIVGKQCHVCHARKTVKGMDELTLYIEKGMAHGHEIKFEEFGEEKADIAPGHLIFVVNELPHPTFRREKNDLHTNLVISLKEALLGFQRELEHLDGRKVQIKKDGVIQPGDIIKVKREGMPIHQSSETGDLYVKIEIKIPQILTEKQIEIAKLLFDKRSYW